jgi:hypothetical protein
MNDLEARDPIAQYLHDHAWDYHLPGGQYDVARMADEARDRFGVAAAQLPALHMLAQEIAAAHCGQCGAALQAGGRSCFCCGWSPDPSK